MNEKSRLMAYLDEVRSEMRAIVERIDPDDPEQEIYPGWGMRETIVHITGWDEVTIKALRAHFGSGGHYLMPAKSFDAHNDDMLKARVGMSFEDVLQEWEEIRATLKAVLAELSEEDLTVTIPFPWGLQGTIKDMLYIIAEHEREHAMELDSQY
jgi:hypothetical protein